MKKKNVFVFGMIAVLLLLTLLLVSLSQTTGKKNDKFTIVTSFYPVYIASMQVTDSAEGIQLINLSEPQSGCLHDFQLTPEDMKLLSTADVFVINGGGAEAFLEDIAKAYPKLTILNACEDVPLLLEEEEQNAHAWMRVDLYKQMVQNIAKGLSEKNVVNKAQYEENAKRYLSELEPLLSRFEALKENFAGEKAILLHEAFAYTADCLNLEVSYVLDLDEERQISAGEVADVVSLIQTQNVKILFVDARYGEEMAETLKQETGVKAIYLDPINRGEYDKNSYIEKMSQNLKCLEAQ